MASDNAANLTAPRETNLFRVERRSFYWFLDVLSEFLIYGILVFSAWAFGATEHWAIDTLNPVAYILGALLVAKAILRKASGFKPARWDGPNAFRGARPRIILIPLAVLTGLMLAYIAIAAWNARAEFLWSEQRFE